MIKKLIRSHVNFIVVQYFNYLTEAKIMQNEGWEILIPIRDRKVLKGISLDHSSLADVKLKAKVLGKHEIAEFKSLMDDYFHCVVKDSDGAVYELLDKSFLEEILNITRNRNE